MKKHHELLNEQSAVHVRFNRMRQAEKLTVSREIYPIHEAEQRAGRYNEVLELQLECALMAKADGADLVLINNRYQDALNTLFDNFSGDYEALLRARDSLYDSQSDTLLVVGPEDRVVHLNLFREKLERREFQTYRAFKIDESNISTLKHDIQEEIKQCLITFETLQDQKTQLNIQYDSAEKNLIQQYKDTEHGISAALAEASTQIQLEEIIKTDNVPAIENYLQNQLAQKSGGFYAFFQTAQTKLTNLINEPIDEEENTLLHRACYHGAIAIVAYLLRNYADLMEQNINEYYPIHETLNLAALNEVMVDGLDGQQQHLQTLQTRKLTILNGLLQNHRDRQMSVNLAILTANYGRQPLHTAAYFGNLPGMQWLLEHGADINAQTSTPYGETALHLAISAITNAEIKSAMVRLLLERGANHTIKDGSGRSPLVRALLYANSPLIGIFYTRGIELTAEDRVTINNFKKADHITALTSMQQYRQSDLQDIQTRLLALGVNNTIRTLPQDSDDDIMTASTSSSSASASSSSSSALTSYGHFAPTPSIKPKETKPDEGKLEKKSTETSEKKL